MSLFGWCVVIYRMIGAPVGFWLWDLKQKEFSQFQKDMYQQLDREQYHYIPRDRGAEEGFALIFGCYLSCLAWPYIYLKWFRERKG